MKNYGRATSLKAIGLMKTEFAELHGRAKEAAIRPAPGWRVEKQEAKESELEARLGTRPGPRRRVSGGLRTDRSR